MPGTHSSTQLATCTLRLCTNRKHNDCHRFLSMRRVLTFPFKDGGTFDLEYALPGRLLESVLQQSSALQHLWADALSNNEPSPNRAWRTVIGFDEFTPGNLLQGSHQRKCMVLSISWLELGQTALSEGPAWISPLVMRSHMIDKIQGGWSHVLRKVMEDMFFGPEGLSTVGAPIVVHGRDRILFCRIAAVLSGGDGLRQALGWRGAGSMKPCFRHFNLWREDHYEKNVSCICVVLDISGMPLGVNVGRVQRHAACMCSRCCQVRWWVSGIKCCPPP